jgi:hypothetical protein
MVKEFVREKVKESRVALPIKDALKEVVNIAKSKYSHLASSHVDNRKGLLEDIEKCPAQIEYESMLKEQEREKRFQEVKDQKARKIGEMAYRRELKTQEIKQKLEQEKIIRKKQSLELQ